MMKTTAKIFSLAAFCMLLLFSVSSCSKNESKQESTKEDCSKKTEAKHECCSIDENTLMIVAVVTIKNEADKAALEEALHKVVDGTRTEEGNISYVLHQDINNSMAYIIFEIWKSQEAIDFHNQTPHFKAFVEAIGDKADLSVHTMKKVY